MMIFPLCWILVILFSRNLLVGFSKKCKIECLFFLFMKFSVMGIFVFGWFQADRTDVEEQPPAKRRLLSAVVKVESGMFIISVNYQVIWVHFHLFFLALYKRGGRGGGSALVSWSMLDCLLCFIHNKLKYMKRKYQLSVVCFCSFFSFPNDLQRAWNLSHDS